MLKKNFYFFFENMLSRFIWIFLPERFKWLAKTRHLHWLIFFMHENFQSIHLFKYKAKNSLECLPNEAPPCGEMNMLRRDDSKVWEPFASVWSKCFGWMLPFMASLMKPPFWEERGICWNAGWARVERHFEGIFLVFFFYIRRGSPEKALAKY